MTYHWYQTNLHMNIKISVWICKIKSKFELWIFIIFNEIWIKHCPYPRFEGIALVSCEKLLHICVSIAAADLLNITSLNVILSQFPGHKFRDSPIQGHFPHMKTKPHFDASLRLLHVIPPPTPPPPTPPPPTHPPPPHPPTHPHTHLHPPPPNNKLMTNK